MVDRSAIANALLLADRGYESYNNLAHIQEKGWKFLIRIQGWSMWDRIRAYIAEY